MGAYFSNEKVVTTLKSALLNRARRRWDPETFADCSSSLMPFFILYGVPGTGKTHLVRELCGHLGLHLYEIHADSAHQKYVGEGEEKIRGHFEEARELVEQNKEQDIILFIDEIDSLFPRSDVYNLPVNVLKTELADKRNAQLILIECTNNPGCWPESIYVAHIERYLNFFSKKDWPSNLCQKSVPSIVEHWYGKRELAFIKKCIGLFSAAL